MTELVFSCSCPWGCMNKWLHYWIRGSKESHRKVNIIFLGHICIFSQMQVICCKTKRPRGVLSPNLPSTVQFLFSKEKVFPSNSIVLAKWKVFPIKQYFPCQGKGFSHQTVFSLPRKRFFPSNGIFLAKWKVFPIKQYFPCQGKGFSHQTVFSLPSKRFFPSNSIFPAKEKVFPIKQYFPCQGKGFSHQTGFSSPSKIFFHQTVFPFKLWSLLFKLNRQTCYK